MRAVSTRCDMQGLWVQTGIACLLPTGNNMVEPRIIHTERDSNLGSGLINYISDDT